MNEGRPHPARFAALLVDREGVDGAVDRVYEKTFAELAPIVGARGVRAIFARAVQLASVEQPVLRSVIAGEDGATGAASLRDCLAGVSKDVARSAAVAVYTTFFALVATFIGLDLTTRLLQSAWPDVDFKEKT